MARQAVNRVLTGLLAEADWSAADLARAVNTLGAAQGVGLRYDRTSVAHWMTGSRPHDPVPDLVAQAFSRRIGRLVTACDTGLAEPPTERPGGREEPIGQLVLLCRGDTSPAERARQVRTPYRLSPVPAPDWTGGRQSRRTGLGRSAATADTEVLDEMTLVFWTLSGAHGGGQARTALAAYVGDDASRLLVAPAPQGLHRRLLAGTAQLTHLLGTMTMDNGHQGLAQRYFAAALALAHEGERPDRVCDHLTCLKRTGLSARPCAAGHRTRSGRRRDRGPLRHPRRARLPASPAGALPRCGRPGTPGPAGHGVGRGRARRRAPHRRTVHRLSTRRPDYQRGETFHALGMYDQATAALRQSIRHRATGQHRNLALTHARLAEVLLGGGDVRAACSHWDVFLDHYPHLRSGAADHALDGIRRSLRSFPRHPRAIALHDRVRAVQTHGPGQ